MNIYLDIETIPSTETWVRDYVAESVTPPGNMKKPETIAKWIEEEKAGAVDDAMAKCSFDGAMNHIVCIGMAIDDGEVETFAGEERWVLSQFFEKISLHANRTPCFVGHNIAAFDLRVIRQRSIILGMRAPDCIPFDAKPWDFNRIYDTMIQWDAKTFARLNKLALAMGIPAKAGDGCMVYEMWKAGQFKEIADYCADDVRIVRAVHKRMTFAA